MEWSFLAFKVVVRVQRNHVFGSPLANGEETHRNKKHYWYYYAQTVGPL